MVGPDGATEAHGIGIADAVHACSIRLWHAAATTGFVDFEGIPRPRVAPAHAEAYMALLTAEKNMRAAKAGRRTARTAVVQNAELVENVISVLRMAFPDGVYDALEVTKVEKTTHATPRYRVTVDGYNSTYCHHHHYGGAPRCHNSSSVWFYLHRPRGGR